MRRESGTETLSETSDSAAIILWMPAQLAEPRADNYAPYGSLAECRFLPVLPVRMLRFRTENGANQHSGNEYQLDWSSHAMMCAICLPRSSLRNRVPSRNKRGRDPFRRRGPFAYNFNQTNYWTATVTLAGLLTLFEVSTAG